MRPGQLKQVSIIPRIALLPTCIQNQCYDACEYTKKVSKNVMSFIYFKNVIEIWLLRKSFDIFS